MTIILIILAYLFIVIWPVRFAARAVGARRDSVFMCIVAIIIVAVANNGLSSLDLGGGTLTAVAAFLGLILVSGAIYMIMLDTSFKGGIAISLVQTVLSAILLVVFVFLTKALFPELEFGL